MKPDHGLRSRFNDNMTAFRIILLGFSALIFLGGVLLCLPVSSSGSPVPFIDALFTSASATCVTGLVIHDTGTCWSLFGRSVILLLIQTGGLGIITIAGAFFLISGKKIGVRKRTIMQEAVSAPQLQGIVGLIRFILIRTLLIEACGAVLLMPVFLRRSGFWKSLGFSIFHSISAFCNAGFDLMGSEAPFSSLTAFRADITVNLVICALIIIGGIGFLTWRDLHEHKFRFQRYTLQTKLVLVTTAVLIVFPFLFFFLFEFKDLGMKERILCSLFQAVTPRTAGFNTADIGQMSEAGQFITIILMMIGGASCSTAGGIKIVSVSVLIISSVSFMRRRKSTSCFGRRLSEDDLHTAVSVMAAYLILLLAGTVLISMIENTSVLKAMFECASALGTVGLTTGITPSLAAASKIILILFMFFGRVGGLTIAYSLVAPESVSSGRYPAEKLIIG